jgi:hypothetical protein
MATDYRYDQFNDVLEAVERVELHIVPSVSPFVIHLDEVPLRGDPSTVIVREVTGTVEGVRQYGRTFTEVAETPAQDAFRLDYNTGADNDANWNTGAMIFNAADASVMVEVTYQATGTLASLKTNHYPSWWTDRGDGSDGDFYPTEDTTIEGVKNYASVMIPEGVTVSVSPAVLIKCQGAFVNMGTVTAEGQGAAGGIARQAPGEYDSDGDDGKVGFLSTGGAGGAVDKTTTARGGAGGGIALFQDTEFWSKEAYRTSLVNNGEYLVALGAGGGSGAAISTTWSGAGGGGGGGILVTAGEVYNGGTISANGASGGNGDNKWAGAGGGGGGGAVVIIARRIGNAGTITANGGATGTGKYVGAAGEDGVVYMKEVDGL